MVFLFKFMSLFYSFAFNFVVVVLFCCADIMLLKLVFVRSIVSNAYMLTIRKYREKNVNEMITN